MLVCLINDVRVKLTHGVGPFSNVRCTKQAALSDMLEEGISDGFDLEGSLIED